MNKQTGLVRSSTDRMVAGVCAGIAEHYSWPVTRVRAGFAALSVLSAAFPGMLVYLLLWMIMPDRPREKRRFRLEDFRKQ
ncbi:PspC domain-containing protein [soil metagenome]